MYTRHPDDSETQTCGDFVVGISSQTRAKKVFDQDGQIKHAWLFLDIYMRSTSKNWGEGERGNPFCFFHTFFPMSKSVIIIRIILSAAFPGTAVPMLGSTGPLMATDREAARQQRDSFPSVGQKKSSDLCFPVSVGSATRRLPFHFHLQKHET